MGQGMGDGGMGLVLTRPAGWARPTTAGRGGPPQSWSRLCCSLCPARCSPPQVRISLELGSALAGPPPSRHPSPALPHQALQQPLQPRALPQAAELAGESPVRVSRGPAEGTRRGPGVWGGSGPGRGGSGRARGPGPRAHLGGAGRAAQPRSSGGGSSSSSSSRARVAMVGAGRGLSGRGAAAPFIAAPGSGSGAGGGRRHLGSAPPEPRPIDRAGRSGPPPQLSPRPPARPHRRGGAPRRARWGRAPGDKRTPAGAAGGTCGVSARAVTFPSRRARGGGGAAAGGPGAVGAGGG